MTTPLTNVEIVKAFVIGDPDQPDLYVQRYDDTLEKRLEAASPTEDIHEDPTGVLDHLHPEAVLRIPPSMPYGGDHIGHEGFMAMTEANNATWREVDDLTFRFQDIGDDEVLCRVSFTGTARRTGRVVEVRMVEIFRVADGKVVDITNFYWDIPEMLAATEGAT
jgi:ketosteroid isomerase-like protein